jgi:DNA primase
VIIEAGLAVQPDSGRNPYDRFRNRLTFPVRDAEGRIIAFGGRILGDGEPKYLNSPESPVFHKRSTLFCLDRARRAIADAAEAVVVEGYFDCLSLHRVGLNTAVATLGTALTSDHARLLRRRVGADGRVVLCYDADTAGRRAAAAGAKVLLEAGIGVAVVGLPPGSDPDDIVRERGGEAMRELLDAPSSLIEFLVEDLPDERSARQREAAELALLVGAARDPHARDGLFLELTQRVGFSEDVLRDLARRMRPSAPRSKPPAARRETLAAGEHLLARIIVDGGERWRGLIAEQIAPEHISNPRLRRLIEATKTRQSDPDRDEDFIRWLQTADDDELLTFVAEVSAAGGPELSDESIRHQLGRVLLEQWKAEAGILTGAIRQAEAAGDFERVAELQRRKAELRSRRPEM